MKKFLTLTVLCLSVFMANAFTCGDYAYKPWSVEDLLIGFPSKPVILGQYSIYISDQAVTLFECINKDIKKQNNSFFINILQLITILAL